MTNLNLYKIFIVVAEEKNITKASEKLFISQPAVSLMIKQLEQELGCKLFERKNKGVCLTLFGEMFYQNIKNSIDTLFNAENMALSFRNNQFGLLRIGTNTSNINQVMESYLTKFVKSFPQIKIQMYRENISVLSKMLANNELDIIFVDKISFSNKSFKILSQYNINYQLIGNIDYYNKYKDTSFYTTKFDKDDIILPSKNNQSRIQLDNFFAQNGIVLNPKYELDNYILLYNFVKSGFGMAFVNIDYYKQQILNGEVFKIFPDLQVSSRQIVSVINTQNQNPILKEFAKIINE